MRIPAIKGKIGETIYYIANLSFQQINHLVKRVDSELHTSTSLKEEIQRMFYLINEYNFAENKYSLELLQTQKACLCSFISK